MEITHWKSILGLIVMPFAFYIGWVEFYFALLFLIWSIQGIRSGNIFFLENISRHSNPTLYWIVTLVWLILSLLSLAYSEPIQSVQGKAKKEVIERSIAEFKNKQNTKSQSEDKPILNTNAASEIKLKSAKAKQNITDKKEAIKSKSDDDADKIIGVWEVSNDYYMAVYEIEKYAGNYIGKVHYYNDGQTEYTGKNTEDDYFLEGLHFENGVYINGKMHVPDGSFYYVTFTLNGDELTAKMTVENQPYTEVWKRKKYE